MGASTPSDVERTAFAYAARLVRGAVTAGLTDVVVAAPASTLPLAWTRLPLAGASPPVVAESGSGHDRLVVLARGESPWDPPAEDLVSARVAAHQEEAFHLVLTESLAALAARLHDGPAADIAGLGYALDAARHGLRTSGDSETLALISRARRQASGTADGLRREILVLRERVAADRPLAEALQRVTRSTDVSLRMPSDVHDVPRLPLRREQAWLSAVVAALGVLRAGGEAGAGAPVTGELRFVHAQGLGPELTLDLAAPRDVPDVDLWNPGALGSDMWAELRHTGTHWALEHGEGHLRLRLVTQNPLSGPDSGSEAR